MGTPPTFGGHPQLALHRLLAPEANVLPSFTAVGAPSVVDPQGPDVFGDGTPNILLLVGADLQEEYMEKVLADPLIAVLIHSACPLGQVRRWQHPLVYRSLVDLSTMEERQIIVTYRLDRATIQELCAQLEPDMMSAIRHPTGIPPLVQVL
ncbi:hypothetical protein NDU88_011014 [Pleurodeles waltl]|uniref:Uncharacterized protein n=1 Tax=Pleurodeles waltl TaxID=8319 RepID=A0AAV7QW04_PLEWA|nr:hypothetical protein NDU88_011014 [Pleurodeles waltl]